MSQGKYEIQRRTEKTNVSIIGNKYSTLEDFKSILKCLAMSLKQFEISSKKSADTITLAQSIRYDLKIVKPHHPKFPTFWAL